MGISLVELSKRLGKNRGTISRAVKDGRIPRLSDGTFDFDAVVEHLKKNEDPARHGSLLSEAIGRVAEGVADAVATDDVRPDEVTTEEEGEAGWL